MAANTKLNSITSTVSSEREIQIAPKSDAKIKEKVSRKLNKRSKHESSYNPIATILISMAGIFIIVPSVLFGVLTFFGAGFKYGLDATVKMYNELMEDSKKWAK